MRDLLSKLCLIPAVSGREDAIRDFIIKEVSGFAECNIDQNGNLICFKKGKKRAAKKIMVDAHMDEIGFIATYITSDGFVKFASVGGISSAVKSGKRVVFENGAKGVIGIKPKHLASKEEQKKYPDEDKLYIDIGADSKNDAERLISVGDTAVFESEFYDMGQDRVMSRALDNRTGVAALITLLKRDCEFDFYATFTVQEEVGLRGAKTAAFTVAPDGAIVLDGTTAADLEGVSDDKKVCKLDFGPAVSFMDKATLYDRRLYDAAMNSGLSCQPKSAVTGGNNAGAVHLSRSGVPTVAISVPCRYIHSALSIASIKDICKMCDLAEYMVNKMASGEIL